MDLLTSISSDRRTHEFPHSFLWAAVFGLLCIITLWSTRKSSLPTINAYPWDWTRRRALRTYNSDAKNLISDGFAKFHGPFRIITSQGPRIVLPSSYTDWVKSCKDLDHQALVHDDFFGDYSGFDGLAVVTNPNRILIDVTRTRLSQNPKSIGPMNQQLAQVLEEIWTNDTNWHTLNWSVDTMSIISRMSAAIFVGPELAADTEWQSLTTTYTVNMFKAVTALRQWPAVLRPLVHRFLQQSKVCQKQVKLTREKVQAVLSQRKLVQETAIARGDTPTRYEDMMTWFDEVAAGRPYDRAAAQLALAVSALHTTSEALRQVLLDLCSHPELIEPMRTEIENTISEHGWTMAALARMELTDSVMKESQRLKSAIVGLERKAVRNTQLPDGTEIPYGSMIAVDSSDMWSTSVHDDPQTFAGYRFLRMRQQGGKNLSNASFASSHKEHNTFGAGKSICPGRFFVATEMKIALAHILLKYDMRLEAGHIPKDIRIGFYPMSDPDAKVEVKRRDYTLDISSQ